MFATASNIVFGYNQIYPTGEVLCVIGNNSWVNLDGIIFKAEQ
jgi:hypothetical protein